MYTFKEDTTFVGVSELRVNLDKIIDQSKKHKVLIGRRNKPVAVLMDIERFNHMEELLGEFEDYMLAWEAKKRMKTVKPSDFISLEEAKKRLKLE